MSNRRVQSTRVRSTSELSAERFWGCRFWVLGKNRCAAWADSPACLSSMAPIQSSNAIAVANRQGFVSCSGGNAGKATRQRPCLLVSMQAAAEMLERAMTAARAQVGAS